MAPASRTFRIFVSSTFSDLKEERNALQTYVFPRLREFCERHQARFQAIDLRWGVSDEAGLDQRTIPICLTEIERCQRPPPPNFIVLLGDRYGWRPLPAQVEAEEFEEILQEVSEADTELLLWGEERPGDLRGWYRRDDNAVPPEYCLRPREVDVAEDATETEKEAAGERERRQWRETEKRLRSILLGAIDRLGWDKTDPRRDKYTLSATEQEIVRGVLQPPDAKDHVFAFFRTIKMRDGRALVEGLPSDGSARDFVDQLELDGRYGLDREAHVLLEDLKERKLRPLLEDHVHQYEAEWTGSGITTDHLSELCKDVWWRLARIMVRELKELGRAEPLEREIQSHRMFGRERIEFRSQRIRTDQEGVEFFVGRNDGLRRIRDYIRGREPHLFAVVGVAGSGKSALMAKAAKQTEAEHPAAVVVRFIGATPGSSDVRTLLSTLCGEIARAYGAEEAVPTDYHELVQEFAKRLALASEGMPLVIFLDGLDQLSDAQHARGLAWLPGALPDHVRVVVSALPGECEQALTRKYPVPYLVELGAMSDTEGEVLLDLWLEVAGRTLGNRQRRHVRKAFRQSGRLPLYLRLAFEEARLWRSYTDLTKTPLRRGIPRLIRRNLFHRLAMPANHGATLVSHGLGYLAASRFGLSEDEVVDVLSADGDVLQDSQKRAALPQGRSPARRDLVAPLLRP
jgi:signal recognition particle GTPase